MARVRVSIPATINSFGPGLNEAALALRLYQTVDLAEVEAGFSVEAQPARSDAEMMRLRGAVIGAIRAVCRVTGRTPTGLRATIDQGNLAGSGLGLSAGLPLGCVVAVNALMSGALGRDDLLRLVLGLDCHPAPAIASLVGNLAVADEDHPTALHAVIPPASQEIIIVIARPDQDGEPEHQPDVIPNMGAHTALLVDALRTGNHALLHDLSVAVMTNRRVRADWRAAHDAALDAGASACFVHERERSAVVFARSNHEKIVEALAEVCPRAFIIRTPIETRGISIDALDVSAEAANPPIPARRRPSETQTPKTQPGSL